ncbi:hypothetical protein F2Q70_00015677, partial [Brassica cretica]
DVAAWEWWNLSIIFSISECFGFLVRKWRNQSIHRSSHLPSSSSMGVRYRNEDSNRECDILDIGGYVMKIPFITFQIILFLSLEGTSASPKNIPIVVLFAPLFLLQGARVLFITYISLANSIFWIYTSVGGPYGRSFARSLASVFLRFFQHGRRFVEKSVLWIYSVGVSCGRYFATSTARIFRGFFQHGVRLLGCWSVDEGSQEEQARLYTEEATETFALHFGFRIIAVENLTVKTLAWTPFQYVMATPLLVAFEILLFLHLEDKYDVDLKFVFLSLLAFEVAIFVYNIRYFIKVLRKCLTCMPRYEETMSEEPLLYTWVSIWMVSLIATITFTLLKSRGDVAAWEWWNLSIIFGISECFGFLVTKWRNQSIHRSSHIPSSSSVGVRYRNEDSNRECDILDIGGYVMKIPFITFQNILFLSLEGTSASPKNIPIVVLFVPLFLLQGARVLFITYISLAKSILWIYSVGGPYGRSFARSSSSVFLRFFQHGRRFVEKSVLWIYSVGVSCGRYFAASTARIFRVNNRLLGCWSVDEGSQEEQARLYTGEATGYNTFSPEVVKKMPKSDLVEEVRRLQAALSEQTDISKQEYEKLQDEKILCKVCIVEPIDVVLLPCKHRALCR